MIYRLAAALVFAAIFSFAASAIAPSFASADPGLPKKIAVLTSLSSPPRTLLMPDVNLKLATGECDTVDFRYISDVNWGQGITFQLGSEKYVAYGPGFMWFVKPDHNCTLTGANIESIRLTVAHEKLKTMHYQVEINLVNKTFSMVQTSEGKGFAGYMSTAGEITETY